MTNPDDRAPTEQSRALVAHARAVTDELARHPVLSRYWHELSLALEGSAARGNADHLSDIDLVFFADAPVRDAIVQDYREAGLTTRRDGIFCFVENGHYHVRTFEHLRQSFAAREYIPVWEFANALLLHDPSDRLRALLDKESRALFADPLAIARRAFMDLQLDLDWLRHPLVRGDAVAVLLHVATLVRGLCRAAYLLDARPYPSDKWLMHYVETTRFGQAHGSAIAAYAGRVGEVSTLRQGQPYTEHPLYAEAAAFIEQVGAAIARDHGPQPWLGKWWEYVLADEVRLLVGQGAVLQTILIRVLQQAPVDDDRLLHGSAHRPVEQAVLLKIGHRSAVKAPLEPMSPNVTDQPHKEALIHAFPHQVLVRPFGHGLRVGPVFLVDKAPQVCGETMGVVGHWTTSCTSTFGLRPESTFAISPKVPTTERTTSSFSSPVGNSMPTENLQPSFG
ncbi:MAG: nucleotidyltransferase domain-containing protein [Anaerolineae bacterium]